MGRPVHLDGVGLIGESALDTGWVSLSLSGVGPGKARAVEDGERRRYISNPTVATHDHASAGNATARERSANTRPGVMEQRESAISDG
jgi:hypothetical protein